MTDPTLPKPPDRVGRYRILGPLGSGGMGTVWKALDDENQAVVALKLLGPEAVFFGTEGAERFKREATALSRLPHPNIVRAFDAGEAEGIHYLALELVEGGPLSARTHAEIPLARRIEIARDVARALAHAHRNGVIHRDVKPSNVLLRADGSAVLTDFGLARDLARQTNLTQTVALLGTPAYMSPEQAEGVTRAVDARSDVYSLGVVLYELVSGRLPFLETEPADLLARIREDRPPPLAAVASGVPVGVQAVVAKAMERLPEDRYADGTAMLEDLERLAAGVSPAARMIGGAEAARREVMRRPGLLAAAGLATLLVGLALLCGGGPSRLSPSSAYRKATSALDAFLDAEARPLAVEAARLDVPRLTAALDEIERTGPGDASTQVRGDLETEIDAARLGADVVCVVNRTGDLVSTRGPAGSAEVLCDAWRATRGATRVVAITDVPWIGAVAPLHPPGEGDQPCGWALAGRPLDAEKVSALAATHEVVVLWEVRGASWQSGAELRDDARMALDAIGERAIPGGREVVRFAGVLRAPVRVAGAAAAIVGAVLLVAALRRRARSGR